MVTDQSAYRGNQLSEEALKMMLKKGIPPGKTQVINMIGAGRASRALYEMSVPKVFIDEDPT